MPDGSQEWTLPAEDDVYLDLGESYRNRLYAVTTQGRVAVLDLERGAVTYTLPGVASLTPADPNTFLDEMWDITFGEGLIFVQAGNVTLAFDLPTEAGG